MNCVANPTKRMADTIIRDLIDIEDVDQKMLDKAIRKHSKGTIGYIGKNALHEAYVKHVVENSRENTRLGKLLVKKAVRSSSGVLPMTMVLPPKSTFSNSCDWDCVMCPSEPNMPKSYHSNEPAIKRAAQVGFDAVKQFNSRASVMKANGHPIDKIEFILLGGTFVNHNPALVTEFIRDLFYAVNVYFGKERERLSLEEEQKINETADAHVIGISVETRPDTINIEQIRFFRQLGITRIQLGVQHTDNALLKKIRRGHGIEESESAIQMLMNYGFKVDIHLMPDLPDATPEGDKEMFKQVFQTNPNLRADYVKIYPCLDVTFTELKRWKEQGKWTPYAERDINLLLDVLVYATSLIPRSVRVNRVQRDFCEASEKTGYIGYDSDTIKSNLAQILDSELEKRNMFCQCIRCREVMGKEIDYENMKLFVDSFPSGMSNLLSKTQSERQDERMSRDERLSNLKGECNAMEYYISYEKPDPNRPTLYGFVRLRLTSHTTNSEIEELRGKTALIRELHVYGKVQKVRASFEAGKVQHSGIGTRLIKHAENIARENGFERMAIISGVGVRDYYRKQGYRLEGTYMVKDLNKSFDLFAIIIVLLAILCYYTVSVDSLFRYST